MSKKSNGEAHPSGKRPALYRFAVEFLFPEKREQWVVTLKKRT
jgi:hypothetical protein